MLASGIRRQIERNDLDKATIAALEEAECVLWTTIDAAEAVRAGELELGARPGPTRVPRLRLQPQRRGRSNAVQLWSTVYLVVKPPTPEQNPLCTAK